MVIFIIIISLLNLLLSSTSIWWCVMRKISMKRGYSNLGAEFICLGVVCACNVRICRKYMTNIDMYRYSIYTPNAYGVCNIACTAASVCCWCRHSSLYSYNLRGKKMEVHRIVRYVLLCWFNGPFNINLIRLLKFRVCMLDAKQPTTAWHPHIAYYAKNGTEEIWEICMKENDTFKCIRQIEERMEKGSVGGGMFQPIFILYTFAHVVCHNNNNNMYDNDCLLICVIISI